ncbi:NUDIX domain-containing protein [Sphingomonas morindae]|uniref:NUDIX domain-containing protein n=1 Tax=Sphingomonas morindae TaxID=1541170 RepID=A0ABY4X676_9SPHN|nr:NUDIX domain-containing protein [Sphingomonas morindae]USI72400.1 NUDIX domain-containing protein [Sphingomonas morindae]
MGAVSAGILLHRPGADGVEVLLVHPGGPYWARRDAGAWQIPKGAPEPGETMLAAALREFAEELGSAPHGAPRPLPPIRQAGGKQVCAFALAGDFDPATLRSQAFDLEWPPRSGRIRAFPEVDRAAWFRLAEAEAMMLPSQRPLLEALAALLEADQPRGS